MGTGELLKVFRSELIRPTFYKRKMYWWRKGLDMLREKTTSMAKYLEMMKNEEQMKEARA